jgi:hypothetical protein
VQVHLYCLEEEKGCPLGPDLLRHSRQQQKAGGVAISNSQYLPYENVNCRVVRSYQNQQNVLVTGTQLKTFHKQQMSHIKHYSNQSALGIQLLGKASTSNIGILERFQSKALPMIVEASWYVRNTVIRRDLQIPTVKEEIRRYSPQYIARLSAHPNDLTANLMELPDNRRL